MVSRTFHVLYVPDGLIAGCIDALRLLANPTEKHRAHITVRGPYSRRRNDFGANSRLIEGSQINILGAGNFFEFGQNTVFLQCGSPKLQDVWDKPDYGFNPHITLYDGPSREFANRLWDVVSRRSYGVSFVAGPLTQLVSSRRNQGAMNLHASLDSRLLKETTGLDLDGVTIDSLAWDLRLQAIDKLCEYLSTMESGLGSSRSRRRARAATELEIQEVDPSSPLLVAIKTLAKKNSATLGFLPEGAFDAYAERGWILAAVADGDVAGFVVYRVSNMRAVLVHLCTEETHRGQGIAKRLFRSVVERTSQLRGILANTRRDFPAHTMWPRLGFAAIGEKPGRGARPSVLTRWWYEHPHPTLFSNPTLHTSAQSPIEVAIDLNIFYDLVTSSSRKGAEESRSLQNDWLIDEIQLCVTGELFNEITRLASPEVRQGQRDLAHEFTRISGPVEVFDSCYTKLSSIMGLAKNDRESSDLRHLAHTAAAEVEFFVTRDEKILKFRKEIENETGVIAMRPADLLIEIDQVRNLASYQPVRLLGTALEVRKVERQQRENLEIFFINRAFGEKKSDFRRTLSTILPSNPAVESAVILDNGEPMALYGTDRTNPDILTVPCLRFYRGRLARTLARQIIAMVIESSTANHCSITSVTDDWLEPYVEEALAESGFVKVGVRWIKLNYAAIGTGSDVSAGLEKLLEHARCSGFELPVTQRFPLRILRRLTADETALLEKNLRPLKLTNDSLDTLVIPIQPRWAQHLFDAGLAEQTLFGARPDLVMTCENAYYRSPRALGNTSVPFRILWYVSEDDRYAGTGQIRAYSVGSSVEVLAASEAHSRYKRLGVYDWHQVREISDGDPDGLTMVIRFRDTEIFDRPINRDRFSRLLEASDQKKPLLMAPQRISESAFADIYKEGQSWL